MPAQNTHMIQIEKWKTTDAQTLEELYSNVDQSHCLVALPIPLPKEQTDRYMEIMETGINGELVFECRKVLMEGKIIGKIDLNRYPNGGAELDIVLRKEYTGKGIGTECMLMLEDDLKKSSFASHVHAYVRLDNIAMVKVLERTGFVPGRRFEAEVYSYEANGPMFAKGREYIKALSREYN